MVGFSSSNFDGSRLVYLFFATLVFDDNVRPSKVSAASSHEVRFSAGLSQRVFGLKHLIHVFALDVVPLLQGSNRDAEIY